MTCRKCHAFKFHPCSLCGRQTVKRTPKTIAIDVPPNPGIHPFGGKRRIRYPT